MSSSGGTVTIIGLTELTQMMSQFPSEFNRLFQQTGMKFAKEVYNQAHSKVPVRTGYLKSTIGQQASSTEIRIFANAPYAAAVNYGTRWMRPRPFLTQPAQQLMPQFIKELDTQVGTYFKSRSK